MMLREAYEVVKRNDVASDLTDLLRNRLAEASRDAPEEVLYRSQGKVDLAQQIAHTILRRSISPLSSMARSSRNPFRRGRAGDLMLTTPE